LEKITLVIGASANETRYSYLCVQSLVRHKIPVLALGLREDSIENIVIHTGLPHFENVHTVTLYVGPSNQVAYYDYILHLKPERVIFNPGTENPDFEQKLTKAGIIVEEGCTLVMLQAGVF